MRMTVSTNTSSAALTSPPQNGRTLAGIVAALAFGALAVQPLLGDYSYLGNLAAMLRFFTIWGNVAACVVMALVAIGRTPSPGVMAALATALAIIGGIYWGLLAGDHNPQGFDRITNQFHHTIIPIATIGWWLRYTPPAPSILRLVPMIMVPPLTYGAFALILGQMTGFYAYFFVDLPSLGWTQYLINNAGLAVFFAFVGSALVAFKQALGRAMRWEAARDERA